MKGISRVFFLAIVAQFSERSLSSSGAPLENPFPLGTIGCLASDVCGPGEVCKDDLLFGSCQDVYSLHEGSTGGDSRFRAGAGGSVDVFRLKTREIEQLEEAIWTLIQDGFTWQDAYTQCTLQNILVAFQRGYRFSPRLCEDALGVSLSASSAGWPSEADAEIAAVLKELLQSTRSSSSLNRNFPSFSGSSSSSSSYDNSKFPQEKYDQFYPSNNPPEQDFENGVDLVDSAKRDEFVQVHKYFDQSKGQLKRDPYLSDDFDPYNFITAFPQEHVQVHDSNDIQNDDDRKSYEPYQPLVSNEVEKLPDDMAEGAEEKGNFFDMDGDGNDVGMESSMGMMGGLMPVDSSNPFQDELEEPEAGEMEDSNMPLSLSPRDEAILEQLLEGTLEPDQLPVEQQKRLSHFIEMMIGMLEMKGTEHLSDVDVVEEGPKELPPSEDNPIATQKAASSLLKGSEMIDGDNKGMVMVPESLLMPQAAALVDESALEAPLVNKKSPAVSGEEDATPEEHNDPAATVKTHFTFIKFSKGGVDENQAYRFLHNLTAILKIPPGILTLESPTGDNEIILHVSPNPQWNSSKLASDAEDHADELYVATGLQVVDAGVGKGVTVEVKKKDGGYVVLTFILVGSIAGVVLAVTIIYLIKRHRRSREKLAQLAATGDGNEASKDYQDLCRQRMQSKASEKPEPLHAASRIGSVSESQVRSPSSRSSTSSWSEEPAATNMDISTGHVVLSYMEDHLKNQDRLEQEWEALAAYQADPCSTAVANDPSNTRKNRYTDVLPYDHSRVVLSAAANVSSSDYVNASFITDHDPRNPAYICTQGPLPHTVADFWQMIWEQGSVVIVMLTKLTENGTAMCHRYWPEEGSDLYHIYEVHLVSEHIWCDDYLVRSFYLKNLQTNETRTVTQFHFLTWPHLAVPPSMKALLDFRRKVNKSFRGGSCPIVVHCNDGCGRSGTYTLIDMVLNRMAKGAKEIDMAATLEHIRDQRMNMVQTKEQFQFSLSAVADEVHAILKAMPQ